MTISDFLPLVIGTWPLSGDYGKLERKTIEKTLEYSYQNNIIEFDTAPNYGNGFMEICLGDVFGSQSDVLINTKMGNSSLNKKSFEINDLKKSFFDSLKRLKRNSVNILYLHNPRYEIKNYSEILNFMNELKDKRLINFIGLSKAKNFDYSNYLDLQNFDVIQDDANLLYIDSLKTVPKGVLFQARSPLASGLLSGNFNSNTLFSSDDQRSSWLVGNRLNSLCKRVDHIKKMFDMDLPELSVRFLLNYKKVNKIICGVKNISHINSILNSINNGKLENHIFQKLVQENEKDFGLINEKGFGY